MTDEQAAETVTPTKPAIPAWARAWAAVGRAAAWLWSIVSAVYLHFTRPISFREVLLFAGAGLLAVGLFAIYWPAAFVVPGAILTYVSIAGVK